MTSTVHLLQRRQRLHPHRLPVAALLSEHHVSIRHSHALSGISSAPVLVVVLNRAQGARSCARDRRVRRLLHRLKLVPERHIAGDILATRSGRCPTRCVSVSARVSSYSSSSSWRDAARDILRARATRDAPFAPPPGRRVGSTDARSVDARVRGERRRLRGHSASRRVETTLRQSDRASR